MKIKIGFLLAAFIAQPVLALEITHIVTPAGIIQQALATDSLESTLELLGRCSVEERKEFVQALKQSMNDWVNCYGTRETYANNLAREVASVAVSKFYCGLFVVFALGWTVSAWYRYEQQKADINAHMDSVKKAFEEVHMTTNHNWRNAKLKVNGVPISNPWFVDGNDLINLYELMCDGPHNFAYTEEALQTAGVSAAGAGLLGIMSYYLKQTPNGEETLARYDRMQALVAYLEK